MDSAALERDLLEFLADSRNAVVVEDGAVLFDLAEARYSVSSERGRCLLHLWSSERNLVRRVLDAEHKNNSLSLTVQRFGQTRPQRLEICRDRDRRSPTARKLARTQYQRLLERMLARNFPEWRAENLSSAMDLERSFGPVYTRGLMRKGNSAVALLGLNAQESQAAIDASLTFGLLWLEGCRKREAGRSVVKGLKLFLPPQSSAIVRSRVAHLSHSMAEFHVYELDERQELLNDFDVRDGGNIATRLVRKMDESSARLRWASEIGQIVAQAPEAEVVVLSSMELSFRLHGLEFARARNAIASDSFQTRQEIVFGAGAYERVLDEGSLPLFSELVRRLRAARIPGGDPRDPLCRMYPERWLESSVRREITLLDSRFDDRHVYIQVPAFAASDRAMIDVLTVTQERRLAVIELKADEDIHLPLQGLDYWARVRWHQERGEFQAFGYFLDESGKPLPLSSAPPQLFLVAPALRVHPAVDAVLRYFPPSLEWELVGIDERWREELRVVFRKRRARGATGA